ncbi:uncharacterized protein Dana_GF22772, isoform E [Drosophila ananassae]|uniref:Uncharacterized protein, isoform A n=1 Tax=Drosophila ananassae TaxID=7217 RepID=B3MUV9_DROAN|nr:uncharacterized protein LOC6505425 [Drosophila ananassae]XP_014760492.1 uncharacterized protein LOC6505425 [Drosophila ananassae]XP_014760493.1 uncharacterized protein LOC6505425 [Drosophila ananassae]XP_014760494.1 uncharacterized protein LOC6505425 [Drosophila ananassae]XP_032310969.1 uncharacterized protein LOC6505425 [Drosophila ananassae]XP_044571959.1 uncharacterized protein LOC6505425 [Drosophila ananassae]EDV33024.1 uncharacterized protein Dana_GF22772, isoform A [Drosophila ananas
MTTSTRCSSNTNSKSTTKHDSEERDNIESSTTAPNTFNYNRSPTRSGSGTSRVMQADEDFNIRFVNLVRHHKCLYDKKLPEYRNRDNQEKAWILISKETRESVIHCKERWRNLRACLSRYIKQQAGSEPQHKPYYLTEHMAFLLPFLKSTRNSLESNTSLASLYQLSQHHSMHDHKPPLINAALLPNEDNIYCSNIATTNNNIHRNGSEHREDMMVMKHSISENDDEETIDAFDPTVASTLCQQRGVAAPNAPNAVHERIGLGSPARSETASADSMQNFIPDVQLAETGSQLMYGDSGRGTPPPLHYHPHTLNLSMEHHAPSFEASSAKRIKTECEATSTITNGGNLYGGLSVSEASDMDFFRSILPDIANLTAQQRRKFKIGILELIDDVVTRYPSQERCNGSGMLNGSGSSSNGGSVNSAPKQSRRTSGREWRKQ